MRALLGVVVSALLHVGLVASAFVYFPAASRLAANTFVVPVELVTLSDITNVRAARPEPEPEPLEPEPQPELPDPGPEAAPQEAEPEAIPPAPEPESEPETIPPPTEPEDEPDPTPPPPEPEEEPAREPERRGLDLDSLSGLIDRSRDQNRGGGAAEEGEERRGAGAGTAMTATLQALAVSQITPCVRSNADAPSDMNLAVVVEVRLERNGTLSSPPRLRDGARITNSPNPFLRIAGERALRAVIDCAPYELPPQNYAEWRLLEVNVDTQRRR